MNCKVCHEPLRWHILLGVTIPAPQWHSISEGYVKPSDIVDFRTGHVTPLGSNAGRVPKRVVATLPRVRLA